MKRGPIILLVLIGILFMSISIVLAEDNLGTCIDNDGGMNLGIIGTVTITDPFDGHSSSVTEECENANIINECRCTGYGTIENNYGRNKLGTYECINIVCPAGCKDGVCINPGEKCYDSDDGKNYAVKGYVSDGRSYFSDECADNNMQVHESYCLDDKYADEAYSCPNGCKNGACIGAGAETISTQPTFIPSKIATPTTKNQYLIETNIENYNYNYSTSEEGDSPISEIKYYNYIVYYKQANELEARCRASISVFSNKEELNKILSYFSINKLPVIDYKGIKLGYSTSENDLLWTSGNILISEINNECAPIADAYLSKYPSDFNVISISNETITPLVNASSTTANIVILPTKTICQGCSYDDKCLSFGYRIKINETASYCDVMGGTFEQQKEKEAECQNDYECLTNDCKDGKCVSTYSLLQSILDFIKKLFGGK